MPTYVYKFIETGETIEVQQSFDDDALTEAVHPKTGATMQVKKVFLPVGVTFRGGGFYKNDSRTPGKNKSKSDTTSTDTTASNGDSKSDTTSASTKTETSASTSTSSASTD